MGARCENLGGASRDRTDDLIVANDALSQLSYSPAPDGVLRSYFISLCRFRHQAPHRCRETGISSRTGKVRRFDRNEKEIDQFPSRSSKLGTKLLRPQLGFL